MRSRDPLAQPEPLIERVYAYVAYRLGSGPDAEDVTSEVFERALRYRASYDRSKSEPIGWLLGIARRCVDSELSGRREFGLDFTDPIAPGDLEERAVDRLTLAAALDRLSERERELIALRYGADLTVKQIAATVGERVNTVEVALHRALGRLRTFVEAGAKPVRKRAPIAVSPRERTETPTGEPA